MQVAAAVALLVLIYLAHAVPCAKPTPTTDGRGQLIWAKQKILPTATILSALGLCYEKVPYPASATTAPFGHYYPQTQYFRHSAHTPPLSDPINPPCAPHCRAP